VLATVFCLADSDRENEYKTLKAAPAPTRTGTLGFVEIDMLRPTQIFLGFIEVKYRASELEKYEKENSSEFHEYLLERPIKVVVGPGGQYYIVDHHHMARALSNIGKTKAVVKVMANLGHLTPTAFWERMAKENWVYPYSPNGRLVSNPQTFARILRQNVNEMIDDPYRSLAWAVKRAGGFTKGESDYYIEFVWANFFRDRIELDDTEDSFLKGIKRALQLIDENPGLANYIRMNCKTLLGNRRVKFENEFSL
jgi:hypothetical protein